MSISAKSPNILFILADDLGWNDLGAGGSTFYESPHIDRIAYEGMRFTNGYATCQVCSPSRASILTGQYTPRHGITDWIGAPVGDKWRKLGRHTKALPPDYSHNLGRDQVTFAEVLRRNGYKTFFAGKWHMGDEVDPEDFGFEINKGGWDAGSPRGGYFSPWVNPKLPSGPPGECLPIRLANETNAFIEASRNEPFLAYLSFYSVHSPLQTSQDRWRKFRDKTAEHGQQKHRFFFDRRLPVRCVQDHPVYAGMIAAMDDAVGLVLDKLDELDLADNTIVIFTSDNGGVSSGDGYSSSMLPLRGGKGRQWEGGIREPFYVRAPGLTRSGSACDVPVSGIDFYPTLLELTGLSVPDEQFVDGKSIVSLMRGEDDEVLSNRDLYWHYPHYGNQGGDPSSVIRNGKWKLINYHEDGHDELYDLQVDPGEQRDVLSDNAEVAHELKMRLVQWIGDIGAKMAVPDPVYNSEAEEAHLDEVKNVLMPKLEEEHAKILTHDWSPNEDWWNSQPVTVD